MSEGLRGVTESTLHTKGKVSSIVDYTKCKVSSILKAQEI